MEAITATRTERPAGLDASTVAEYAEKVRRTAAGLAGLGLGRGDAMGIMLTNRPEFHWFDAAALHLGATPFSIYNTYAPEQVEYQLKDARANIVITETAFADRIRGVEHVIVVDDGGDVESHAGGAFDFESAWRAVQPGDVLTLIYTSGTTGPPKGVQLTHANIMAECRACAAVLPMTPG